MIDRRSIISFLGVQVIYFYGSVELVSPCCRANTAVTVGSTASFLCCGSLQNDSKIHFNYLANGSSGDEDVIASKGTVKPKFNDKFEIYEDEFTKLSALRLLNATFSDYGEYDCRHHPWVDHEKVTHLSVLQFSCWLRENGTLMELGCDVTSTNPAVPMINCSTAQSATVPLIHTTTYNGAMSMSTFHRTIESSILLIGTQISCDVYVDWPQFINQSGHCNNSSPSYVTTWTSKIISQDGLPGSRHGLHVTVAIVVAGILLLVPIILSVVIVQHVTSKGCRSTSSGRHDYRPDLVQGTLPGNTRAARGHSATRSMPDLSVARLQRQLSSRMPWASTNDVSLGRDSISAIRYAMSHPEDPYAFVDNPYPPEPVPPPVPEKMACIAEANSETEALYADLAVVKLSHSKPLRRPPLQTAVYAAIDHTIDSRSLEAEV